MTESDTFNDAFPPSDQIVVTDEESKAKRLNKLPLIIGAGILLLILMVVMYGGAITSERSSVRADTNPLNADAEDASDEVFQPARAPNLPDAGERAVIPSATDEIAPPEPDTRSIVIPESDVRYTGAELLAAPDPDEAALLAEHRLEMVRIDLEHEKAVRQARLDRQLDQVRNGERDNERARNSEIDITGGAGAVDGLLGLASANRSQGATNPLTGVFAPGGVSPFPQAFPVAASAAADDPRLNGEIRDGAVLQEQLLASLAASSPAVAQQLDQDEQDRKKAFIEEGDYDPNYLDNSLREPVSPYEIKQGTVIPGAMVTGLNSDLPGRIIGQVTQNVYDTTSGAHLLIPQGTRVFGRYDSDVTFGQNRALIVWTRLIYPNGTSIDLDAMAGSDERGASGLKDKVDRHLLDLYGNAILLSAIGIGVDALTDDISDNDSVFDVSRGQRSERAVRDQFGRNIDRVTGQILERNAARQPTIKVRSGKPFLIIVDQDLVLRPYQD